MWAAVTRLLSPSLPIYSYDRSGYASSEPSPLPPTAETIAAELALLLVAAGLNRRPLIIVGHSWGGIILREFIARTGGNGAQIAGVVLVDANQPRTLQVLDWRNADLAAVGKGVDGYRMPEFKYRLTKEEWEALLAEEDTPKHQLQEKKEETEYGPSFEVLAAKELGRKSEPVYGDKPLCVLVGWPSIDWKAVYRVGVERGNGTEEERRKVRELISTCDEKHEGLQRENLSLSSNSKLVDAKESGHFIHLSQPDLVADGVKWVLEEYLRSNEK